MRVGDILYPKQKHSDCFYIKYSFQSRELESRILAVAWKNERQCPDLCRVEDALFEDTRLASRVPVMVHLPGVELLCLLHVNSNFLTRTPSWDFKEGFVTSWHEYYCLDSLSSGSTSLKCWRQELCFSSAASWLQLSFLLAQAVPWGFMGKTVHWYASAKTELTATTSPGSAPAAPGSWGSTASKVSMRTPHL